MRYQTPVVCEAFHPDSNGLFDFGQGQGDLNMSQLVDSTCQEHVEGLPLECDMEKI